MKKPAWSPPVSASPLTPIPGAGGGATTNEDPTPIRGPVKPNAVPEEPESEEQTSETTIAV